MGNQKRGSAIQPQFDSLVKNGFRRNPGYNQKAQIETMYQMKLTDMCANRFEWKNLPNSVDPRFLEMMLFYTGLCVFYFDEDYDKHLAVRGSGMGHVNMLDNPVSFNVIGPGAAPTSDVLQQYGTKVISAYDPSRHEDLPEEEKRRKAIPIWSNYIRAPDINIVSIYANKFAELDRTIEINARNARRTKVIAAPENMRLSAVNAVRQIDEGGELIQITGPMSDMSFLTTLDLDVNPDTILNLHILKQRLWNECMGLLGIENSNQDKKERLVADEVQANNEQSDSMKNVNLNARQQAAKTINEVFDTDISVDYKTSADKKAQIAESNSNNEENE